MELDVVVGIYPLHTITHTNTHKHTFRPIIIAEWPLPPLPVELRHWWRKAVSQHLN